MQKLVLIPHFYIFRSAKLLKVINDYQARRHNNKILRLNRNLDDGNIPTFSDFLSYVAGNHMYAEVFIIQIFFLKSEEEMTTGNLIIRPAVLAWCLMIGSSN